MPRASPWSAPAFVVEDVYDPQVAAAGGDDVLLVWERGPGDGRTYFGQSVWARRFVKGRGFGPSERLWDLGYLAGGPLGPRAAVSPSGGAVVAWSVPVEAVWAATFDPASGWSAPLRLAGAEYCGQPTRLIIPQSPAVAADGADEGFVVFNEDGCCTRPASPTTCAAGATLHETYASRWSLKGSVSSPEVVLQAPLAPDRGALVAADVAGNAFVARVGYPDLQRAGLAVARFDATRGWLPADVLPVPDLARLWALATDAAGQAHVLWSRYARLSPSPSSFTLWAATLGPSTGWEPPRQIASSDLSIVGDVTTAWARDGGGIAIWAQLAPPGIWASRSEPSGAWETPEVLQEDLSARCPAITSDGLGGFVAAWQQADAEASSIWAAQHSPSRGWGPPALVASAPAASAWSLGCPLLAPASDGHPLLFWERSSTAWPSALRPATGDRAVYMSRFEGE